MKHCLPESLKKDDGFAGYVEFLVAMVLSLMVLIGCTYGLLSIRMSTTLTQAGGIVNRSLVANGGLTINAQNQLNSFLKKNYLDPSKIYLNTTTSRQSMGSTGLSLTIGYDFDLYAPSTKTVLWHKYYEVSVPSEQSQYIPGATGDNSGIVASVSPDFGGIQGGTSSGGSGSGSNPSDIATSMTIQVNKSTVMVNNPVGVSGTVVFGSNPAPSGTQVSISGGGIVQNVTTDANGQFSTSVAFTQPGTITVGGTCGIAMANATITVKPNAPNTITLQVPNTIQVGQSLQITGAVLDQFGNPVSDGTQVQISSSDSTDIPSTIVTTIGGNFYWQVPNGVTSLLGGSFTITASSGSATNTQTLSVIPGNLKAISFQISKSTVTAGGTVTFSGKVTGPYGSPAATTNVTILSGTDVTDSFPTVTTDANGNFSVTATITVAGNQEFYAQATGPVTSLPLNVTVVPGVPYKVTSLNGVPSPVNQGSNMALSGIVLDNYGNLVSAGTTVKVTASSLVSPTNVSTASSGNFQAELTFQSPGIQTLTITDGSGNPLVGGSFGVQVLGTAAYSLTPSQNQYSISAGQAVGNVTFTLKDSNGQPVQGKTIQFVETPQGNSLITPTTAVTDSSGHVQTTVGTLTSAGSQALLATLADDTNVVGTVGIVVTPGSPGQVIANVSPSTTQVNKTPYPVVSGIISDTYGNAIAGANISISGGYGPNAAGSTGSNGYYAISIDPTNIGGPFLLYFNISSAYGNYSTSQGTITVTTVPVVPVQDVLEGVVVDGQTGTMPNMSTRNPNGMGVGRSAALQYWTGGGPTVFLKPQKGFYDGIDTWAYYNEPSLVAGNIKSGVTVLGVTGTYAGASPTHGSQSWTTPGTYSWTVPDNVYTIMGIATGGGGGGGWGGFGWSTYYTEGGSGGGGGTNINTVAVTPGQALTIVVGHGGIGSGTNYYAGTGTNGESSSINGTLVGGGGEGGPQSGSMGSQRLASGGTGGGWGQNGGNGNSMSFYGSGSIAGGTGFGGYGTGGTGPDQAPGGNGVGGRVVITW